MLHAKRHNFKSNRFAVASYFAENYRDLANITIYKNHKEYCEKHGYDLIVKKDDKWHEDIGFGKISFLIDNLSNYEWIWLIGCDTLIMNYNIKIEDKIDDKYSFIIGADINGPNADSFLVKNSPEGFKWLKFILGKQPEYTKDCWKENRVIHHFYNCDPWKDSIKSYPQRYMNSYLYQRLYHMENEGEYQAGDWLLHMPGIQLAARLQIVEEYQQKVIK